MSRVETLKQLLAGCKLRSVDPTSDPPTVEIIAGLRADPTNPEVLTRVLPLPRTEEIINHLNSSEMNEKLLVPKERGLVLVDVVGYSLYDALGQAAILALLQQTVETARFALGLFSGSAIIEQIVPTGDGCYFILAEHLNDRFVRAALAITAGLHHEQVHQLKAFDLAVEPQHLIQVTIACHLGAVDFFRDVAGNRNCFGPGMNEAARILDLGKKAAKSHYRGQEIANTIFFGAELLPQITPIKEHLRSIQAQPQAEIYDLGKRRDKLTHLDLPSHVAITFDSLHDGLQPVFFRA